MEIIKRGKKIVSVHYLIICPDCESELKAEEKELSRSTSILLDDVGFYCPVCEKNHWVPANEIVKVETREV